MRSILCCGTCGCTNVINETAASRFQIVTTETFPVISSFQILTIMRTFTNFIPEYNAFATHSTQSNCNTTHGQMLSKQRALSIILIIAVTSWCVLYHGAITFYSNEKFGINIQLTARKSCLVIVLAQVKASDLTFQSFKKHVLTANGCDLALSVSNDLDENENPYYKEAKYVWNWKESSLNNVSDSQNRETAFDHLHDLMNSHFQTSNLPRKHDKQWKRLFNTTGNWLGPLHSRKGSGAICAFFRQFTYFKILEQALLRDYDYFFIVRGDYKYLCDFPFDLLTANRTTTDRIWISSGEDYGGIQDRDLLVHKSLVLKTLNIVMNYE